MEILLAAHDKDVRSWRAKYHAMRLHELLNSPTEDVPELTLHLNGGAAEAVIVELLGDDATLAVFVKRGHHYIGAILQQQEDWWKPVAPPQVIPEEKVGRRNARLQVALYAQLVNVG